jgi:alcohol dehydrogenase (cytochrome c)
VGTLDDLLIAIDARTGRELWERRLADTLEGYTITSAPLIIPGEVIVGAGGGEFGLRGFLDAYDPASGQRLWRFYTIPAPGEPGSDSWTSDSWKRGGGGTWLTGSFDARRQLLYWAVGNPAPNFNPAVRKGDNLYTDSVVALDPNSGQLRWHYQFTPNDSHDWDAVQDIVLTDRVIGGARREVLLHADRNGFFYTLDRQTGRFISAVPFVRQTWNGGFDANGRPVTRPDSIASPNPKQVYPALGATNFQAPSFDDKAGVLYIMFEDGPMAIASGEVRWQPGQTYNGGRRVAVRGAADDSMQGIKAINVATGRELWRYELTRRSGAAGVLGTRGGVLFAASGEGNLLALDSASGNPLWHFKTGGPITASPISYAVDGRQYVAIVAGNTLYTFRLPQRGEL